jgi:hypothetical protein
VGCVNSVGRSGSVCLQGRPSGRDARGTQLRAAGAARRDRHAPPVSAAINPHPTTPIWNPRSLDEDEALAYGLADRVLLAAEEVAAGYRRGVDGARFVDEIGFAFGWIAPEPRFLQRASHTLASDGRVWVIDSVADERALESARELGEPAGLVQLLDRPARPSSRLAAARKTRSLSSSRGQEIWRRSTASSWRSTTISSSLNSRDRKRSATTASARRNSRYSNDTTTKQPPSTRVRGARHYGCDSAPQRSRPTGWICATDRLDPHVVELDPVLLVNVNTVADLLALTP